MNPYLCMNCLDKTCETCAIEAQKIADLYDKVSDALMQTIWETRK